MKSLVKVVPLAIILAAPVVSFAQTNQQPLTRAQVRADLIRAEQAGYSPLAWADYPYGEFQAAKFRAAVQKGGESGYGSGSSGTSQAGDIAR